MRAIRPGLLLRVNGGQRARPPGPRRPMVLALPMSCRAPGAGPRAGRAKVRGGLARPIACFPKMRFLP